MKIAMTEHITVRSFRRFITEQLPAALAAVAPLTDYQVEETAPGVGRVVMSLGVGKEQHALVYDDLPFPRPDGSFGLQDGGERAVAMTASSNNFVEAEIKAVGEQLVDEIAPRLTPPPDATEWDEAVLRAWFPLGRWLRDFLRESETSQWLDGPMNSGTNRLARFTHLRRIWVIGTDVSFHPSQIGRVCPYETPEGPNTGRWLTLAVGADVADGKIVAAPDREDGAIGPAASLVPLLCHNDPTRQFIGANMMRQWIPQGEPELPLVRSGHEPEDGSFSDGRNFLTALVHWKGMNYEEGIVISESAAARLPAPERLEVGDKLSNRHGCKGGVGAILPDAEMPHLPDGRAVDLVFDPMGVYSRLNFGQLIEAAMGLVAEKTGEPVIAPPFRRTTPEELHAMLRAAGLPESGQFVLRDGQDGPELDQPVTVGVVYWGKTMHRAQLKLHHHLSTGRPQPLQRAGRNEYLALRDVGAFENIIDAYLTRAPLDGEGDNLMASAKSGFLRNAGAPPAAAFRRVQRALRTGMVDLVFAGDHVTVSWATPGASDLELAEPLEHPWLAGAQLTHLGPTDWEIERYGFEDERRPVASVAQAALDANQRLAQTLRANAPAGLRDAARAALRRAVDDLLGSLLIRADLDFHARMQFSARAVLSPGYDLKLGEVGVPEEIAWALFGPLIAGKVGPEALASRSDRARRAVEKLMAESIVIINRAPTWEPTAITAFTPVMTSDLCLRLHPLCCRMFNADYDGDQAAVWLPLSEAAQREAQAKLTVAGHLRRDPSVVVYHLTPSHAVMGGLAYACESAEGRDEFAALWPQGGALPAMPLTRAGLAARLLEAYENVGPEGLLQLLDGLYAMGVKWATKSGASFSPFVGEGLRLPPAPTSTGALSWDAYGAMVETEIAAQADADLTLRDPLRAVRCGARGAVSALRATVGPWGVVGPYDANPPIPHGFRDGLTGEELWLLVARTRAAILSLYETQINQAIAARLAAPPDAGLLRRAIAADDPAPVFAAAAAAGETDPLADADTRLWVGLPPLAGQQRQAV